MRGPRGSAQGWGTTARARIAGVAVATLVAACSRPSTNAGANLDAPTSSRESTTGAVGAASCTTLFEKCKTPSGPLGVCDRRPCEDDARTSTATGGGSPSDGTRATCWVCVPQH